MRWNEGEIAQLSQTTAEWEGKLMYKPPKSKNSTRSFWNSGADNPQERWFRLRANCLFYFRLVNGGRPALGAGKLCFTFKRQILKHLNYA